MVSTAQIVQSAGLAVILIFGGKKKDAKEEKAEEAAPAEEPAKTDAKDGENA